VTDTAVVLLGAIALATLVMAFVQVGAIVYAARAARRAEHMIAKLERDVAPIIERLTVMSGEASRAASLAALQVEKIDRMVTDVSEKVDRTLTAAQRAVVTPAREGAALMAAVKATVATLRELRRQRGGRFGAEDDDALFIG
jgi:hypothetical protein